MSVDRTTRSFREFNVIAGPIDSVYIIRARSSLEAVAKFREKHPDIEVNDVKDPIECQKA